MKCSEWVGGDMSERKFSFVLSNKGAIEAEEDIFGRNNFRDGIISLFKNSADPLVVLLDEPWGTGKTFFAERLYAKLKQEVELKPIYFDAFVNDHEEDVFIALASEMLSALGLTKTDKSAWDKTKKVAKILGRVALKGAVRAATAGAIQGSDLGEAEQEAAKELANVAEAELDQLIDSKLKNFSQDRLAFDSFRSMLAKNAAEKPIVFIVDELDRCKPTYALSVLETIKHFFSVAGVHFFLISNSNSLEASIQHAYGDVNGRAYLQKFVSLTTNFPVQTEHEKKQGFEKFINLLLKMESKNQEDVQTLKLLKEFLLKRSLQGNYSLRDLEKLSFMIKAALSFSPPKNLRLAPIIAVLLDLKLFEPRLYQKARNGTLRFRDIRERYGFNDRHPQEPGRDFFSIWWKCCLDNPGGQGWEGFGNELSFNFGIDDPKDVIELTIRNVIDVFPEDGAS